MLDEAYMWKQSIESILVRTGSLAFKKLEEITWQLGLDGVLPNEII